MNKLNGCMFSLEIMRLFGINSALKNSVKLDSESVYNKKILKTKIKSNGDMVV